MCLVMSTLETSLVSFPALCTREREREIERDVCVGEGLRVAAAVCGWVAPVLTGGEGVI